VLTEMIWLINCLEDMTLDKSCSKIKVLNYMQIALYPLTFLVHGTSSVPVHLLHVRMPFVLFYHAYSNSFRSFCSFVLSLGFLSLVLLAALFASCYCVDSLRHCYRH